MRSAARNEAATPVDREDIKNDLVISVVDDDESIRDSLRQLLRSAGYQALTFDSAESFLKSQIEQSKCIILDVKMPGIGGLELQSHLSKSGAAIPVIFVTAHDDSRSRKRALDAGAAAFLSKPLETRMLLATIENALSRQSQDDGHSPARQLLPSDGVVHAPAEPQWLTELFSSIEDGMIVTDLSGRVVLMNPAAENITGCTRSLADGKAIDELFSLLTLTGSAVGKTENRRHLRGETTRGRYLVKSRRGIFPVERIVFPIRKDGRVFGYATIFRDLTVRLREEGIQEGDREHSAEQIDDATRALEFTRTELQRLSEHFVTAQEDERRRLSREIHDDLGQRASLMGMAVDELVNAASGSIRNALLELRGQLSEFSTALRNMSHQLHPSLLEDLGLDIALEYLAQDYRKVGIEVNVSAKTAHASLPLASATALYRIAQEALSNAARHAHGSPVQVTLGTFENELRLIIQDSGPGFSLADARLAGGLGLLSMQERARIAGGTLQLSTKPGAGTLVLARVPLSGAGDERPHPHRGGPSSDR